MVDSARQNRPTLPPQKRCGSLCPDVTTRSRPDVTTLSSLLGTSGLSWLLRTDSSPSEPTLASAVGLLACISFPTAPGFPSPFVFFSPSQVYPWPVLDSASSSESCKGEDFASPGGSADLNQFSIGESVKLSRELLLAFSCMPAWDLCQEVPASQDFRDCQPPVVQ